MKRFRPWPLLRSQSSGLSLRFRAYAYRFVLLTTDAYEQLPSLRAHLNLGLGKGSCPLYVSSPAYSINTGDQLLAGDCVGLFDAGAPFAQRASHLNSLTMISSFAIP